MTFEESFGGRQAGEAGERLAQAGGPVDDDL